MRWHRSIWRKLGVMKCSLSFESRSWFVTANMFCSIGPCPFSKASLACRMCKKFAVAIANLCKTNFFSKSEKLSLQTFCVTINLPTIIWILFSCCCCIPFSLSLTRLEIDDLKVCFHCDFVVRRCPRRCGFRKTVAFLRFWKWCCWDARAGGLCSGRLVLRSELD